ncbi:hypothetical protein ACFL1N_07100 [Thermodesulfobacteriota bacterium]
MRKKTAAVLSAVFLAFAIFFAANTATGQSHEEAIPIGGSVKTQINCSKSAGGIEVYDGAITLLEVIRGSGAWGLIKKADGSNKKPGDGYEYILARVSFKMKARGAPGDKTFDLDSPLQFTAFSSDFEEYESPAVVIPEPALRRTVSADQYAEGWVALAVRKQDSRPLLMFDPSSGGAWSRGKISFFKLYE